MPDLNDTRDLQSFAIALAEELPGTWRSDYHQHTAYPEQADRGQDVWDMNLVSAAIGEVVLEHDAVLTRDDGLRLYVIGRPHHEEEYLVGAMAPHDIDPEAFRGVREPDGIVVADDPFLAADDVTADLLPRYDKALAQVRHNAAHPAPPAPAPAPERVVMTWVGDGDLAAKTSSREAARALRDNGFTWDPGEALFVLSGDDTAHQARCVREAGAQLATHGIGVIMRRATNQTALDTNTPPPAAQRVQPARTR